MMRRAVFIILGTLLLLAGLTSVHAAEPSADWPSLGADAAQSNYNPGEHTITAQNALKLHIHWSVPTTAASYPIVSGGQVYVPIQAQDKVHVKVYNAATGKFVLGIPKDAAGGMVAVNGDIYLAGHTLQAVDGSTGEKIVQIDARPKTPHGEFINPVADRKVLVTGYATSSKAVPTSLYAIDPEAQRVTWKSPSIDATGAIGSGKIVTSVTRGTAFYDESTGRAVASQKSMYGQWFSGDSLLYTVAGVGRSNVTLYAYTPAGTLAWKRVVGPRMVTSSWPHAVTPDAVYTANLRGRNSVEALDPTTGKALWNRPLANVERMVEANNLLFVLTYGLGQPTRVVVLHADTGKAVGAIVLSSGFVAFNSPNALMVADGMVFLRVQGMRGNELVALGL